MSFFNILITCEVMPMLGAKKTCKNPREYCTFEPTGLVPSTFHQPLTDTTAQGPTNNGHVTAQSGKGNVETRKNMKIELSLIRNTHFCYKTLPPIPRGMAHGVESLSASVEAAGRENM